MVFWAPCRSGQGAGGWEAFGGMGGVPTHMHTYVHARTHTHTHLYMYRNCKWPPTWRHPCLSCLTCMCVRACEHAWDISPHTHTNPYPHPPICHPLRGVDPRNHLKFDNTSTYQDISILFKDLKSVKNFPCMGGCVVWLLGGWLGGLMGGFRSNH